MKGEGKKPWETEWEKKRDHIKKLDIELREDVRKISPNILRVNQLDAARLDLEIEEILSSQFMSAFAFFKVSLPNQNSDKPACLYRTIQA